VVFSLRWFRFILATSVALLPNAAPSMISLSSSASPATTTSATSALGLKRAAHFVAVDGTRECQGHGTPLYLHAKRQMFPAMLPVTAEDPPES